MTSFLRALVALTLALLLLPWVAAPVAAGHPDIVRYVAATDSCRIMVTVEHDRALDESTPLEVVIFVEGLGPHDERIDIDNRCGSYTGGVYCGPVVGSIADGFSCTWRDGRHRIVVGGIADAESLAPGVYGVPLDYLGWQLDATATVIDA